MSRTVTSILGLRLEDLKLTLFIIAIALLVFPGNAIADQDICENEVLRSALQIIYSACTEYSCEFDQLFALDDEVDQITFLTALHELKLSSVHIFFPRGESSLECSFDWWTSKRSQLTSLMETTGVENATIFIIGRASITPWRGSTSSKSTEKNRDLSAERMNSVRSFLTELRNKTGLGCSFKGGYFGREIMQLSRSDASYLFLDPLEYREDALVLNQSVHVLVYPCDIGFERKPEE